jgi:hypothetical protein
MCLDANARAQGCVPANVWGIGTMSDAAIKYIQAPQSLTTKVTQKMAGASVSGEPFDLPAGPVGVAAGAEWREEGSSTQYDALTQAGLNGGNQLPNTAGNYNVKEGFIETRLSLTAWVTTAPWATPAAGTPVWTGPPTRPCACASRKPCRPALPTSTSCTKAVRRPSRASAIPARA